MRFKAAFWLGIPGLSLATAFAAPPADRPFLGKRTATGAAPGVSSGSSVGWSRGI